MKFVAATVLGFALMAGSVDAGECTSRCTPVRTVVSSVVASQPVRSLVAVRPVKRVFCRVHAVRPLQRLLNRVRRCC
jgi:hypothetical protein